jgi:hypothetical protein
VILAMPVFATVCFLLFSLFQLRWGRFYITGLVGFFFIFAYYVGREARWLCHI